MDVRVGEHESMLEAIEAAGVEPNYLCRGGVCGQCETAVVRCDGMIEHNDHYLSLEEKAATARS
jgi:ferredoxin